MNKMYSGELQDDKFNLLYIANTTVNIAVRTPVGKTESETIKNIVIQGDVFCPMLCSEQVDEIGKECLEKQQYTYVYKGEVDIPPLTTVDDVICVSECGYKTAMANDYIQCKTSSMKLQFGASNCKKIHVVKSCDDYKCLYVDSWEKDEEKNVDNGNEIKDICLGDKAMEEKDEVRYLGDIISKMEKI